MSERDGYQPGVPCWVAAVEPDPKRAASFYAELFGWQTENLMPPDFPEDYIICKLRGSEVAAIVSSGPAPQPPAPAWSTHICVDSAERVAAAAASAGGTVIAGPWESPAGGRMAVLTDPAGAAFVIWEPAERKGAQLVNEPGAWAMSALVTPAPGQAKTFYGDLFGWEAETFTLGDAELSLLRLPGFVGGEPQQPVPRDVVGVMIRGDSNAPAQWNVDFWVADADRTADRAAAISGSAVVAPHDMPGFRRAVLADPQGAVFTVSKLSFEPHQRAPAEVGDGRRHRRAARRNQLAQRRVRQPQGYCRAVAPDPAPAAREVPQEHVQARVDARLVEDRELHGQMLGAVDGAGDQPLRQPGIASKLAREALVEHGQTSAYEDPPG
jgi:uncharacterized protein